MLRLKFRHVILIITIVTLLSGLPSVPFFSNTTLATAYPEHLTVTPAGNPRNGVTVTWQMDDYSDRCHVQYAENTKEHLTPYDVRTLTVEAAALSAPGALIHRYSATIQRLKPGTGYYYRVGYGNVWSEWRTFTTAE